MACRLTHALVLVAVAAAIAFATPKKHEPGALLLLLDRSGSMKGEKLEALKQAAVAAVDALAPDDLIAIVTVDYEAEVLVPPQRAANRKDIVKAISSLEAGRGTNVVPGFKRAFELLRDLKLHRKHVIFVSDGESPEDGLPDLLDAMHDAHITASTIGVPGADRELMQFIADRGDGIMYLVDDPKSLPKVVVADLKTALSR